MKTTLSPCLATLLTLCLLPVAGFAQEAAPPATDPVAIPDTATSAPEVAPPAVETPVSPAASSDEAATLRTYNAEYEAASKRLPLKVLNVNGGIVILDKGLRSGLHVGDQLVLLGAGRKGARKYKGRIRIARAYAKDVEADILEDRGIQPEDVAYVSKPSSATAPPAPRFYGLGYTANLSYTPNLIQQPNGTYYYTANAMPSSRMAEKTRRILALREMLRLGLTDTDIEKSLPLLRRLQEAASAPPADPEKAIDEEYTALLRARPGEALPPSSALKMQDAAHYYREEQERVFRDMVRAIGERKAAGIFGLFNDGSTVTVNGNRALFSSSSRSINDPSVLMGTSRAEARPSVQETAPAAAEGLSRPAAPATEGTPVIDATGTTSVDVAPQNSPESGAAQATSTDLFGALASKTAIRKNQAASAASSALAGVQVRYQTANTRLPLTELVALMQEKLNAMRSAKIAR